MTVSKSSVALSNLRAFVIMIVVAFHSILAYLASIPAPQAFDQPPYTWQAFPIVDAQRWPGFDAFCIWQDLSLMSLMFLLSGLLAAGSLLRKGSATYVSDRLWRIGLPFLFACAFLSPLSYYPAYLARTPDASLADFWTKWFSLSFWPAGPQWFLWQLLAANLVGAGLFALAPNSLRQLGQLAAWTGERPLRFFAVLVGASALAYVPLAVIYSPWIWGAFGPFAVQLCRPAHYLVYFVAGLALGSNGINRGLLAYNGSLARHWWAWLAGAIASAGAWSGLMYLTMPAWDQTPLAIQIVSGFSYPVACACGGLTLLALCLRFAANKRSWVFDSLSANAYSIYMVHYVFVVWLQYALLNSGLVIFVKVAIVAAIAMTMSWAISVAFKRVTSVSPVMADDGAITPLPR